MSFNNRFDNSQELRIITSLDELVVGNNYMLRYRIIGTKPRWNCIGKFIRKNNNEYLFQLLYCRFGKSNFNRFFY